LHDELAHRWDGVNRFGIKNRNWLGMKWYSIFIEKVAKHQRQTAVFFEPASEKGIVIRNCGKTRENLVSSTNELE